MIRLESIDKAFGDKILLSRVTYHFPAGEKIALVGDNGAGKTTLLNILCGQEQADGGELLKPQKVVLAYLPQEPNPEPLPTVLAECCAGAKREQALAERMARALEALEREASPSHMQAYEEAESAFKAAGGYGLEAKASAILHGLGFRDNMPKRDPRALSGGWRMRLELAKLFMLRPDFLVLDEPTNHLDLPSLVWVEEYLRHFKGTLLFVSHDRALLNRLATVTLHLHKGGLSAYKGNFDAFLAAKVLREQQEEAHKSALSRRKEELERFVERFGAKATKAKQAQSRQKMIARLEAEEANLVVAQRAKGISLPLPPPLKAERIVYSIQGGAIGYDQPLSRGVALQVERGQKIAVIGANGIGKSTLLKTVLGKLAPLAGSFKAAASSRMAYFAQDQLETLCAEESILANVLRFNGQGEKAVRQLLGGFLFSGDDVFKPVSILSGGEKSRVGLACILSSAQNLLLLDEPTNHLDMASVDLLADTLAAYEGTLLFVSHDRSFIDRVCTHVFAMLADGRSMLFSGKLEDYSRLASIAGFPNVLEVAAEGQGEGEAAGSQRLPFVAGGEEEFKELKRRRAKLEKEIAAYEDQITRVQKQLQELERSLAAVAPEDFTALAQLSSAHGQAQEVLAAAESQWLQAHEEWETVLTSLKSRGRA